jgi:predicted nucleic acid-binding protein
MPTYILDTTTFSDIACIKQSENLVAWIAGNVGNCYISAMSVHELRFGSARLSWKRSPEDRTRAERLSIVNSLLLFNFSDRIIVPGTAIMKRSGEMRAMAEATYGDVGVVDSIIAASAETIHASVLTRNPKHFHALGINALDSRIIAEAAANVTALPTVSRPERRTGYTDQNMPPKGVSENE